MPLFRIVFSGLCAFIPRGGSFDDPQDPPNEVTVLLPNAIEPCILPDAGAILSPHFPLLKFNRRNLLPTDDGALFLSLREPGERARLGVNLLFRRDVKVIVDGSSPLPARVNGSHPSRASTSLGEPQDDDIDNVFPFSDYAGDCVVESELLGSLKSNERRIIARIQLTTGTLRTYELDHEEWLFVDRAEVIAVLREKTKRQHCEYCDELLCCDEPLVSEAAVEAFRKKYKKRTLATKVALEFYFQREVAIVSTQFGGKDRRSLVFVPRDDRPDDEVEIEVRNLEPNDLLGVPGETAPEGSLQPDYSIYYKLIKQQVVKSGARLAVKANARSGGGYGKPCTPTRIAEKLTPAAPPPSTE